MSGWNSLDSVSTLHVLLQIAGFLSAATVIASGMTAYHFWNRWHDLVAIAERARARYAPAWRGDTAMTLHNSFAGVSILGIALIIAFAYAAREYGHRKTELIVAAHTAAHAAAHAAAIAKVRDEADALRRTLAETDARRAAVLRHVLREAEVRHLAETAALRRELEQVQARRASAAAGRETEARLVAELEALRRAYDRAAARHAAEIAELRQTLKYGESRRVASVESLRWEVRRAETRAETEISRLQDQLSKTERKLAALQSQRRLSIEEKNALIDALAPFRGQKVSIAAIEGDEDGKAFAADFVEVFEAAGWEHAAVSYRRWERDPVGVEITLNEADGRAGRIATGVGALINVTRRLSLVDGNTIYMNGDVPVGQVQVKIGKKLPR